MNFPGRDLIGVQNLMKKHQALQAELAGHEPRINNVSQQGGDMIKDGHFAADEIQGKISDLEDRWQALKVSKLLYNIQAGLFVISVFCVTFL